MSGNVNRQLREIDAADDVAERRRDHVADSELTILPNAAPMMMPTAMSTTLPLTANSGTLAMLIAASPSGYS
jgi:hypothetical protein